MHMRIYFATVCLLALAWTASAQMVFETGLFGGGGLYQGDLNPETYPLIQEVQPAFGLFARWRFSDYWGLRTQISRGAFKGNDKNFPDDFARDYSFETTVTELHLSLEWEPFGQSRMINTAAFNTAFTPFFFTGAGLGYFEPQADFQLAGDSPASGAVALDQKGGEAAFRPVIPIGGGIKWDLSRGFTLELEAGARWAFTDYLDGVSETGNPDSKDWYWMSGANLVFRFKKPDRDGDGIVDADDRCPTLAGPSIAQGCPDADSDGVEDAEDACPDIAGLMIQSGCPDTDGDGLMDRADACPSEFGFPETNGCPDRDNDCIADAEDLCPDREGPIDYGGCPDTDGDAIPDNLDDCPRGWGMPEHKGCPLADSDCDGVLDLADECPEVPGDSLSMSGCPDADADGIADHLDQCPMLAGDSLSSGCPEPDETTLALLEEAQEQVQFKTASADLLPESRRILDSIASVMLKWDHYQLEIQGHTDNVGKAASNLKLSERRAASCFDYLLAAKVPENRMSYEGLGETTPIADNSTATGRRLNRRVEFKLSVIQSSDFSTQQDEMDNEN